MDTVDVHYIISYIIGIKTTENHKSNNTKKVYRILTTIHDIPEANIDSSSPKISCLYFLMSKVCNGCLSSLSTLPVPGLTWQSSGTRYGNGRLVVQRWPDFDPQKLFQLAFHRQNTWRFLWFSSGLKWNTGEIPSTSWWSCQSFEPRCSFGTHEHLGHLQGKTGHNLRHIFPPLVPLKEWPESYCRSWDHIIATIATRLGVLTEEQWVSEAMSSPCAQSRAPRLWRWTHIEHMFLLEKEWNEVLFLGFGIWLVTLGRTLS